MAEERQKELVLTKRKSKIEEAFLTSKAMDILVDKADATVKYQVVAHCVNEIKMGWYENGSFVFADGFNIANGVAVFKEDSNIDICVATREVKHANSLVANELALSRIAHITVSDSPDILT